MLVDFGELLHCLHGISSRVPTLLVPRNFVTTVIRWKFLSRNMINFFKAYQHDFVLFQSMS